MILITGGLGFIGSHTVQALLDAGEECVVVQRSHAEVPAGRFTAPIAVEQADATDLGALLAIGQRHRISGIVHLAGSMPWPPSSEPPVEAASRSLGSLFNIIRPHRSGAWGASPWRARSACTAAPEIRSRVRSPRTCPCQ